MISPETAVAAYNSRPHAAATITPLCRALESIDPWRPPASGVMQALCAVAAAWPDLLVESVAIALSGVIDRADLTHTHQPGLDEAFHVLPLLVATPAVVELPGIAKKITQTPDVHVRWSCRAAMLLSNINLWRPGFLSLDEILEIAESAERDIKLGTLLELIEEITLSDPKSVTAAQIQRILALDDEPAVLRYLLNALALHPDTQADVRTMVEATIATLFPLSAAWNALTGGRALKVLCVQNIADGQGDEIVRINPFLQALLDAHLETTITLISDRCYLWDHPRLRCLSFDERERIEEAVSQTPDVLIDCFETDVAFLNYDGAIHSALDDARLRSLPLLDVRMSKGWNRFLIDSVRIAGQEWTAALQLDTARVSSVYEPFLRLMAELGLPVIHPDSEPPLWNRSVEESGGYGNTAVEGNTEHRPVALLNPFGGSGEMKGYTRRTIHQVAPVVTALVEEGYFVVIWLGDAPWARFSVATEALGHVSPDIRRYCATGPEPSDVGTDVAGKLSPAGHFMRLTLSSIQRSALVVTIEGWMEHAAFALGVPFRVLMTGGSQGRQWLPWGRSHEQRCWLFSGEAESGAVPLPEQPRKQAFLDLLARMDSPAWSDVLALTAQSEDSNLRTAAARAIGRCQPANGEALLLDLLSDSSVAVHGSAAASLLTHFQTHVGQGKVPGRAVLHVHRSLAAGQIDAREIAAIGSTAVPILQAALYDDDPVVRRTAAMLLEFVARQAAGAPHTTEQAQP